MRPVMRWTVAVLVTVAVFGVVTWLFTDFVAPLWAHDDAVRLGWGSGAGVAAAGVSALWGKVYATAGSERRPDGGAQVVTGSAIGGGVVQVSGAKSVRITHRGAATAVPARPERTADADPAAEGQVVSGTSTAGPVDQVRDVDGGVEIEQ